MEQQTKTCSNCGAPAKVVPAGTSRKTGKLYNSFLSCQHCGKTQNLEEKPQNRANFANNNDKKERMALLYEISAGIGQLNIRMEKLEELLKNK